MNEKNMYKLRVPVPRDNYKECSLLKKPKKSVTNKNC